MTTVDVNADRVPRVFKSRDQWLLFDAAADTDTDAPSETSDNVTSPRQPHWDGRPVSWNDPDAWHSFDEAAALAREHDAWGVGYVLALGNDDYGAGRFGMIDLDGALDEDDELKDWVPSLDRFKDAMTYMEWSAGGDGVHIPIREEPPEWWTDGHFTDDEHEGVEVLTNSFCTFTGDLLDESGGGVAEIDATPWLLEAYNAVHGEYPRTETDDSGTGNRDWSNGDEWLTADEVEEALSHLDADMGYSEWRDVAFAVHDWDDGSTGRRLFRDWSKSGSSFDREAEDHIDRFWSDTDQGKGITVATLVHKAKEAGWSPSVQNRAEQALERAHADKDADTKPIDWDLVRRLFADDETPAKRARRVAASALQMRYEYLYLDTEDRLLKYYEDDGVFERGGERHVKQVLVRELQHHFSTHDRNEVLAMIQDEAAVDVDELNAAEDDRRLVCLENGVLNLDTLLEPDDAPDLADVEVLDHSPEFRFTRSVPVTFDPEADAPAAEKFLGEIVETEGQKRTLEEMMGAALHPEYLKGKFLFLFGEGANGKGIYFELISNLLGTENVEGRGLHELADERFAKADLHGKLANIGGDIDDRKLKNVGELKRLTSGTDVVTAERKYGQPFKFVNSTTLFFAANEPPAIEDQKMSMARRLVPIRMPFQFVEDPDEEDPYQKPATDEDKLLAEMTTDEELSGLLNLALAGMRRLDEDGDVSLERDPMERLEHYQRFSDPIYRFATECMVKQTGENVQKEDVYEVYKAFSQVENHGVRHTSVFWREFKRVFHVEETQPRDENGDKGPRQLVGTGFSEVALERYAPDKLAAKYSPVTDDDGDDDGDSGPASTRFDPVPLAEAAEDATGFPTVEVEVVEVDEPEPDNAPALAATVKDDSSAMRVVHWNDPDALEEGEKVVIENAGTTTFDGSTQLVLKPAVTEVHPQPGEGQSQLDARDRAAADGGSKADERSAEGWEPEPDAVGVGADAKRVVAALVAADEDALDVDDLKLATSGRYDQLKGDIDGIDAAIEKACEKGYLTETGDGRFRVA